MVMEEQKNDAPKVCRDCGGELLPDQDGDLFCPDDCDIWYSLERKKWFNF